MAQSRDCRNGFHHLCNGYTSNSQSASKCSCEHHKTKGQSKKMSSRTLADRFYGK